MPGQIDRDHFPMFCQGIENGLPGTPASSQSVNQQERLAVASPHEVHLVFSLLLFVVFVLEEKIILENRFLRPCPPGVSEVKSVYAPPIHFSFDLFPPLSHLFFG
jgi:hypothetical protein